MASAALETAQETAAVVGAKTAEGYKDASAGIDTMMNALIDKAALVTKHWKLRPEETAPPFYLTVRHYSMTKMYILSISGLLVLVNSKVVYRHTVSPCGGGGHALGCSRRVQVASDSPRCVPCAGSD